MIQNYYKVAIEAIFIIFFKMASREAAPQEELEPKPEPQLDLINPLGKTAQRNRRSELVQMAQTNTKIIIITYKSTSFLKRKNSFFLVSA